MTTPIHWAIRSCFAFLVIAAAVVLFLNSPQQNTWFPPCIFHKLTGFDCPGCGSARGLHSLLHGRLLEAADHNLFLLPALTILGLHIFHSWTGRGTRAWNAVNRPTLILWIVLAFWILRNLPWWPFSWLGSGIG